MSLFRNPLFEKIDKIVFMINSHFKGNRVEVFRWFDTYHNGLLGVDPRVCSDEGCCGPGPSECRPIDYIYDERYEELLEFTSQWVKDNAVDPEIKKFHENNKKGGGKNNE